MTPDIPGLRAGERAIPVDIRGSGLLWVINRRVFHPDGFELLQDRDGGHWLAGWHEAPRDYSHLPPGAEDGAWRRYRNTLSDAERRNRPPREGPPLEMPWKNQTVGRGARRPRR